MSRMMLRVLVTIFAVTVAGANAPAFARPMAVGDADVAQQSTPAVVNLSLWKMRPPAKPGDPPRRVKVNGSGFIIDPNGIIVTNKHVIDGAINVNAIFSDGTRAHAEILAAAAMVDLAVLKVNVDHPLPTLKWGNSDNLRVGDSVLAIGNPLGIGMSVSAGIVSALNRDLQDTPFDNYIQTDAAINHGNSGGPLVNSAGEVVGIDTALYNEDPNGGFIGIGFALPANCAEFVVDHLLDPSHPKPGWLGVTLQDMTADLSDAFGLPRPMGAIISAIDAGGPASQASLRPGDVLEKVDDKPIGDARAFMRSIVMIAVGKPVELTVWRDGKQQLIAATVGEWPNYMPEGGVMSASAAKMMAQKPADPGVQLEPITDAVRQQYSLDPKLNGVVVTAIESDCEAADLGVAVGDVVTSVQGLPVRTPEDVQRAVATAHDHHRPFLAALVQGKSGTRWISLSMGFVGT
jgi:serine protease Do